MVKEMSYPLSLVPGQFCEKYRKYTSTELRCYPINTVLDNPHSLQNYMKDLNASEIDTEIENKHKSTKSENNNQQFEQNQRAETHDSSLRSSIEDNVKKDMPIEYVSTSESSSSEESSSESDSDSECSSSSSSSESETNLSSCNVCQRTQHRNLKDLPERFIKCYTCRRKVHPSCVEMPHRMMLRVRNYNWQCNECKCCVKCKRKQDENKMLYCEQCDRGYHIYCINIKSVPDCRWSCERCSICMRCGATKPEGLPQVQQQTLTSPNGEKVKQVKHKKVKWINEYRIDHITKLREHCSMLCVPCGRAKTVKRTVPALPNINNNFNNSSNTINASGVNSNINASATNAVQTSTVQQKQQIKIQQCNNTQMSPPPTPAPSSVINTAATTPVTPVIKTNSNNNSSGGTVIPPVVA
ncbi:supporter of activation of yellow protein-like [Teleopsis dalmanni]|nr:supporter of activation of yellow protein-like [Teleopsis dalmanni]